MISHKSYFQITIQGQTWADGLELIEETRVNLREAVGQRVGLVVFHQVLQHQQHLMV